MILDFMQSELYRSSNLNCWLSASVIYGHFLKKIGLVEVEEGAGPIFIDPRTSWVIEPGAKIIIKKASVPVRDSWIKKYPNGSFIGGFPIWEYLNPPVSRRTTIRLKENSRLVLSENSLICKGTYISVWPGQTLSLGTNSYIGHEGYINTKMGLTIGNSTMIGHKSTIMDYDGHPILPVDKINTHVPSQESYGGKGTSILIGNNIWIGFESAVLKGAKINDGAIVGARSVITDNRDSNTISAGNPARTLKEGVTWQRF